MIRLFVALPLPDAARVRLGLMSAGLPGAKWVSPENYHLTLRFVGEVDGHSADDFHDMLMRIDAPGFDVTLDTIDWFGNKRRPHVLVAKARKDEALMHLQRKVESAAVRCGFEPEQRKFAPHVTLARMKAGTCESVQRFCMENHMRQPIRFEAERAVLYSSFLSHNGSIYREEADYPLRLPVLA